MVSGGESRRPGARNPKPELLGDPTCLLGTTSLIESVILLSRAVQGGAPGPQLLTTPRRLPPCRRPPPTALSVGWTSIWGLCALLLLGVSILPSISSPGCLPLLRRKASSPLFYGAYFVPTRLPATPRPGCIPTLLTPTASAPASQARGTQLSVSAGDSTGGGGAEKEQTSPPGAIRGR